MRNVRKSEYLVPPKKHGPGSVKKTFKIKKGERGKGTGWLHKGGGLVSKTR